MNSLNSQFNDKRCKFGILEFVEDLSLINRSYNNLIFPSDHVVDY